MKLLRKNVQCPIITTTSDELSSSLVSSWSLAWSWGGSFATSHWCAFPVHLFDPPVTSHLSDDRHVFACCHTLGHIHYIMSLMVIHQCCHHISEYIQDLLLIFHWHAFQACFKVYHLVAHLVFREYSPKNVLCKNCHRSNRSS